MTIPERRVDTGFEGAFRDLYQRAYRVAYRLSGSRPDAEEIAQETLARAYARWSKLGAGARPEGWVVTVAANLTIDRWRRASRRNEVHAYADALVSDSYADERIALRSALGDLPKRQREVVVLRYLADWPEAEVAAALGCSTGTVKQHASRGLARLRAALGEQES